MSFLVKWIINLIILAVIGLLLYVFFPTWWNDLWSVAFGPFRAIFIAGLIILAALPALRRS
jgi:hypothetical protein